jgi:hypothetical protein
MTTFPVRTSAEAANSIRHTLANAIGSAKAEKTMHAHWKGTFQSSKTSAQLLLQIVNSSIFDTCHGAISLLAP